MRCDMRGYLVSIDEIFFLSYERLFTDCNEIFWLQPAPGTVHRVWIGYRHVTILQCLSNFLIYEKQVANFSR